jgi:hypothetical protein
MVKSALIRSREFTYKAMISDIFSVLAIGEEIEVKADNQTFTN